MKLTSKPKKTGFRARLGKTLLATTLAASLVLGTFPATPAQAATQLQDGYIEINVNHPDNGPSIRMNMINLDPAFNWGASTFNYGSSNTFRMVQGQAIEANPANKPVEPQDPSNGGDPAWGTYDQATKNQKMEEWQVAHRNWEAALEAYYKNPATWKKPQVTLDNNSSGYSTTGSASDYTPWTGGALTGSYLFDPNTPITTTQGTHDITLKGKVKGNPNLDLEVVYETIERLQPNANDVTNLDKIVDQANYIIKVTNTSKEQAQVFGASWNVDTYIITSDNAPFRGPGLNEFTSRQIELGFPTDPAYGFVARAQGLNVFAGGINKYQNSVPSFVYASENMANVLSAGRTEEQRKTAIIYPQPNQSRKFPTLTTNQEAKEHFELADYLGIGYFNAIASTSSPSSETGANYWWHATGGNPGSSEDSGHIVRYNPRVVLPEQTMYIGVTYGNAAIDIPSADGPYLLVNNPTYKVTTDDTNNYGKVELDLLMGNNLNKALDNAKIKMYLPKDYLVADESMTTGASPWTAEPGEVTKTINGKQVVCKVWTKAYTTQIPANKKEESVQNVVILDPIEQSGKRDNIQKSDATSVTPVYAFELEYTVAGETQNVVPDKTNTATIPGGVKTYAAEYKFTHKEVPVQMPFVNPVNIHADIWRDLNGDGQKVDGEGLAGSIAKITPPDPDRETSTISIFGGIFKFVPQGFGKDRSQTYKVTFTNIPDNATQDEKDRLKKEKEKYTWVLDTGYGETANPTRTGATQDKEKIFYKFNNPERNNWDQVLENLGFSINSTTEDPELTFKVKADTADVINLDLRVREYLAGRLSIKPFADQGVENHTYDKGTDTLIPDGKYQIKTVPADTNITTGAGTDGWASLPATGTVTVENNSQKVPAFADYAINFTTPEGFRYAATGAKNVTVFQRNVDSLIRTPEGTTVPIELSAKDLRFASTEGASSINVLPATDNGVTAGFKEENNRKYVTLTSEMTTTDSAEKTLVINAWDGVTGSGASVAPNYLGKTLGTDKNNADRTSRFKWEVINDPNNILKDNTVNPNGTYTLKGNAYGEAHVRVSYKDNPNIYDDIIIKVTNDIPLNPGESITALKVAPVTVDAGALSGELELKATVSNGTTTREITISPLQLQSFGPAANALDKFVVDTRDTNTTNSKFKVKGLAATVAPDLEVGYRATINGNSIPVTGTVKVTEGAYNGNSYQATINPNPIKIKLGTTNVPVTYLLKGLNGATDKTLNPNGSSAEITPTIANTAVANFNASDKGKIDALALGSTTVSYSIGSLSATADIVVYDDATAETAADGRLTIVEVTNPKTNDTITVGNNALYRAYFDANGNGQRDSNEPYIPNNAPTTTSVVTGTHTTLAPSGTNDFQVTGGSTGNDELTITYTKDGKLYVGKKTVTVIPAGATVTGLKLNTNQLIIKQGDSVDNKLKVIATAGGTDIDLSRPVYTIEGLDSSAIAEEYGDKTGNFIRVKGKTVGIQEFTVKYAGKEAKGKVIVIPVDTKLTLDPVFVKKGENVNKPKANVTGTGLTPQIINELEQIVGVDPSSTPGVINDTTNPTKIDGVNVGEGKVVAKLGDTGIETTGPAYVYEDADHIKVDSVTMNIGDTANAGVKLTDSTNPATEVVVPAKYLSFKVEDSAKATFKANTMEAAGADGFSITKRDASGVSNAVNVTLKGTAIGTTKLTAKLGTVTAQGNVTVNPSSTPGVIIDPEEIELFTGDTTGKEIKAIDRATGNPIPASDLEISFEDVTAPGTPVTTANGTVINNNKLYINRVDTPAHPAPRNMKAIVKYHNQVVGTVMITNSDLNSNQNTTYELKVPDYAMYVGQPAANNPILTLSDVQVIEKTPGAADVTRPLTAFVNNTNKHDKVSYTGNYSILAGSADFTKDTGANANLFSITPTREGASDYLVRTQISTANGVKTLEAIGHIAIFQDNPANIVGNPKLVVTEPNMSSGVAVDVAIADTTPGVTLRAADRQDVKIHYTYNDGSEQIISGADIPAFLTGDGYLKSDQTTPIFTVTDNGTLMNKLANTYSRVKGKVVSGITGIASPTAAPATPSQEFKYDTASTPQPTPPNQSFIVQPQRIVVYVGETADITTKVRTGGTPGVGESDVTATFNVLDPSKASVVAQNGKGVLTGTAPGTTTVEVTHNTFRATVDVIVVNPSTAELHVNEGPATPTTQPDPNQPNFTGGFVVPGEVVQVPVGGEVPYTIDLNGVPLIADPVISPEDPTIADADPVTKKIKGNAPGVKKITFKDPDHPTVTKEITVVVTGNADGPTIDITEDRVTRPNLTAATVDLHATVNLGTAPQATVLWVMSDGTIADLNGATTLEEAASNNPAHQVTANWTNGALVQNSARVTAIVLESGKRDTAELYGAPADVDTFRIVSGNPIKLEKNVPTGFDSLGNTPSNPLKIKLVDNSGNEYDTNLSDFDVISSTGPLTLSGLNNRTLEATDEGPKTIKLRHRQSGKELTLDVVIDADNATKIEVKFETPLGQISPVAGAVVEVNQGTTLTAAQVPSVTLPAGSTSTFRGWKNKDTGAVVNPVGQTINAATTFVAIIDAPSTTNELTFNAGPGNIAGQPSKKIDFPKGARLQKADIPVVTPPAGYRFTGWSPDPVGTTPTGNTTYTAQFARIVVESTVKFEAGIGTLTGNSEIKVERGTAIKDIEVPTITAPTNYIFKGWSPANPVGYTVNDPSVTFTAVFEKVGGTSGGGGGTSGGGGGGGAIVPPTPVTPVNPTPAPTPTTPAKQGGRVDPVELNKNFKFPYITGYPDITVRANAPITRAEAASIFARILAKQMEADTTYPSKFSDIKSGKWYSNNVAYLESFSILSGYQDGTFKPNNKITRAEFATMINNFAKPADVSSVKQFSDIKANHWAKPYIDNAVALKWMSGYPDGTFGPDKYITRAEVVSVVNKLIERTPNKADIDSKGKRYKDLTKGFWAYYDVLEASTDRTVFAKKN